MRADLPAIDPHELLDCDGVARLLKVSRKWVEDEVAGDEIPYTRIGTRLIRFTRENLDELFAASRHAPTPAHRPVAELARVATTCRRKAA